MYVNIETKRLRIRPIKLTDAEFIMELVNTDGWLKFIGDRNITSKADSELNNFDVTGRRIFIGVTNGSQNRIDANGWQSGVYLLKVETNNATIYKKLIKD